MTSKTNIPSSSSSSPPPAFRKLTYDVFLSFRGTDTRTNFTDHLYTALKQKGICTFRDDEELERGESIAPSLFKAIEESRYVVVVFSQHYADSSWCLDEIAKVADCMKRMGLKVLPVFYDVHPSDVRNQKGEYFRKAFEDHLRLYEGNPGKVQRWRDALSLVGNLSGWHLQNGSEAKVIQEVVQKIFTEIIQIYSTFEGLVGMDSHLEKLFSYLDLGRPDVQDVRIIGICGMGGIGKTTIAQVVYEKIKNQFEGCCFLKNVREVTEKDGVDHLQEQLLSKLLKTDVHVEYTKMGKDMIYYRLSHKKVLIVLDDVNEEAQLDALCDRNWFGPGSIIIITSRDEHLLSVVEGDSVYKVRPLNGAQAFQLFSMKAFKKDQQIGEDMVKLVKGFLSYADGLPLAIEILGSSVKGRRIGLWPSMLDRLKKNPEKKLMKVLRVSFDSLEEREKQIFLDIACFFKGLEIHFVRRILQGSDANCPDFDIQVLLDRSMVILLGRKLWMHDMIQELGWEVVRQECDIEPGRRSRLWLSNEIIRVLDQSKATRAIQSIALVGLTKGDVVHSLNDSFSDMDNLRLLKITDVKFSGSYIKYLSNELQYLEWDECPLESFPSDFQPDNLVLLDMHSSRIQQLWRGKNGWSKLWIMDLSSSKYLTSTPDFSEVPHLEKLILEDCTSLVDVHPSIGCLEKLRLLTMKNCSTLESLPPFTSLESLECLNLSLCSRLKKFPEIEGDMKSLLQLLCYGTSIEELPTSVARLTGLANMDLSNCKNLLRLPSVILCLTSLETLSLVGCSKINDIPHGMDFVLTLDVSGTAIRDLSFVVGMKSLKYLFCKGCKGLASESCKGPLPLCSLTSLMELDLSDCNLTDGAIPSDLSSLLSLTNFNLSGNGFVRLPESISQLSELETLHLSNCKQLQFIPKLPSSVRTVGASNCSSLKDFPNQIKILTIPELGFNEFTVINSLNSVSSRLDTEIYRLISSSLHGFTVDFQGKTVSDIGIKKWKQRIDDVSIGSSIMKDIERSLYPSNIITSILVDDEIPEWFSTKSEGNFICIEIPPNLKHDNNWHGVAVCAIVSENRRNSSVVSLVHPLTETSEPLVQCTMATELFCIELDPVDMDEEQYSLFGSYSHLLSIFYKPKWELTGMLDQSTKLAALVETGHPSRWEIQRCGIRLVYDCEQDAQWFAKLIPKTNYIFLNMSSMLSGWLNRVDTCWKWEPPCTPPGKQDSTTIMQRKNLKMVIPRYLEAENHVVDFHLNLSGCPEWCMYAADHGPLSYPVSIILPSYLHKCKKWMGIVVYASIAQKELHILKEIYNVYLGIVIGKFQFQSTMHVMVRSSEEPHQLLIVYIPREAIIQEFTQMSETTLMMGIITESPGTEVQKRGVKIVGNQVDLEDFAEALIHCMERVDADTVAHYNKWIVERWIELIRLRGDSCTPSRLYSRTRQERKFELLSQKNRKQDWSASALGCIVLGDEFGRKKWSMHFNEGNSAEIQLPLDMLGDPNWLGIAVSAIFLKSNEVQDIIGDTPDSKCNVLSWHLEFDAALDRLCTFRHDQPIPTLGWQDFLADWTYNMYVPRIEFKLRRQRHTAKVTFGFSSPCLRVCRCAIRLVFKEDIVDLVQSLLCELPSRFPSSTA